MTKLIIHKYFFLAIVVLMIVAPHILLAQNTITISTFEEDTAVVKASSLLKQAYEKLGINMELARLPASRALIETNSGESIDGELIRTSGLSKQYSNLVQIPVVIATFKISVFSKKINFDVDGWDSLKPYKVTFKRGFKGMEKHAEGLNVKRAPSSKAALEMLNMDRTDIVVVPYLDGLVLRKKLNLSQLKILEPPLEQIPLYHYLHKRHKKLITKLTQVLRAMEQNGEIEQFWKSIENDFLSM